jgi:hypothetical protein
MTTAIAEPVLHAKFVGYASSEVSTRPADRRERAADAPTTFWSRLARLHPRKKLTLALFVAALALTSAVAVQGVAFALGA